jgi:hypothetical protein
MVGAGGGVFLGAGAVSALSTGGGFFSSSVFFLAGLASKTFTTLTLRSQFLEMDPMPIARPVDDDAEARP